MMGENLRRSEWVDESVDLKYKIKLLKNHYGKKKRLQTEAFELQNPSRLVSSAPK